MVVKKKLDYKTSSIVNTNKLSVNFMAVFQHLSWYCFYPE